MSPIWDPSFALWRPLHLARPPQPRADFAFDLGLERHRQVLVDVVLSDYRCVEINQARHLDLNEIAHGFLLGEQARQFDAVSGLGRGIHNSGLHKGVFILNEFHHVLGAGTASEQELIAVSCVDSSQYSDALVIIVIPDGIDLRRSLQQVRSYLFTAFYGEFGRYAVVNRQPASLKRVGKPLRPVLRQWQGVNSSNIWHYGVGVAFQFLAKRVAGATTNTVAISQQGSTC